MKGSRTKRSVEICVVAGEATMCIGPYFVQEVRKSASDTERE